MKTALVIMPWIDSEILPLGAAALKAFLEERGFPVDCHYLNLRMHRRLGGLAAKLSRGQAWSEWLFGYQLFGPGGSGELREGVEELLLEPSFRGFLEHVGLSQDDARRVVTQDVPAFLRECLEEVAWKDYGVIGFSSTFCSQAACLTLSRALKERFPEKVIVFGGANVEGEMGAALMEGCPWVDYVIDGEGEEPFRALLESLAGGGNGAGLDRVRARRGGAPAAHDASRLPVIAMDLLPTPDHRDYFAQLRALGLEGRLEPVVSFEASRGCWWGQKQHCTFCGLNGQVMAFRAKDAALVLRDIQTLHARHDALGLEACDNILGLEHLKTLLLPLAAWRRERAPDLEVFFEVKANLTEAQMRALADAGVKSLQPGLESLSTPVLKLMRKGVTAIQNVQTLALGASCGVRIGWNILWGFPGEPPSEYGRMADALLALTHLMPPQSAGPLWVDRFSPHHKDWSSFGIGKPRPQAFYRYLFPRPRFDLERMAYFFDFAEAPSAEHRRQTARLSKAVAFWKEVWANNFFACRLGESFLDLYDSRPLALGAGMRLRVHRVTGLDALLLRACRTIRTRGELLKACRQSAPQTSEAALDESLERMTEARWLFQEGTRWVFLAVPVSALPSTQKAAWEGLLAAEKAWRLHAPPAPVGGPCPT